MKICITQSQDSRNKSKLGIPRSYLENICYNLDRLNKRPDKCEYQNNLDCPGECNLFKTSYRNGEQRFLKKYGDWKKYEK